MTTVKAFNDLMEQFINELVKTFPEEESIKSYQESFEMARMANDRLPLNTFMQNISPYSQNIFSRNEAFFTDHADEIDFLKETNMKKYWPNLSENTKGAIWQYINTLYMLGNTIMALPPDTMSMIENLAQQLESKLSEDGIDESALMNNMMAMLQGPPKPAPKKKK